MLRFCRFVWEEHRLVVFVTLVALLVSIGFTVNFISEVLYFSDPANLNRTVEPWMSMRLVAQSWGLPKVVMIETLGYQAETPIDDLPRTVAEHLKASGMTLVEFQQLIENKAMSLGEWRGDD
ncbi:hypothetical protein AB833_02555 [Chromatiales bacterium (ex Bugula neritina AB1)]|nr:hypothetical protein AB833_02555 [Chromatiales bacterium (ex Bugula neritina AB1)]